jgi:hypothetical protein
LLDGWLTSWLELMACLLAECACWLSGFLASFLGLRAGFLGLMPGYLELLAVWLGFLAGWMAGCFCWLDGLPAELACSLAGLPESLRLLDCWLAGWVCYLLAAWPCWMAG